MDTANSIREYIRSELTNEASLGDDTPLWGGVIDSAGLMHLLAFIEEEFGLEIADDELTSDHFGTVSSIAALVERKRADA